jgi:hypothetical protein
LDGGWSDDALIKNPIVKDSNLVKNARIQCVNSAQEFVSSTCGHIGSHFVFAKTQNEGGGDLAAEHGADELCMPASRRCEMLEDFVTKNIFEELLTDEDGHTDFLETQLDLVTKTG